MRDITSAPTVPVLCDYIQVWEVVEAIQLNQFESDHFIWRWMANGEYSGSLAYLSFFIGMTSLRGAKEVWRAAVPPKVKFFWLALHGRLWMAERRMHHGLQDEAAGALCNQEDETTNHLLTACVFCRKVWFQLLRLVGLQQLAPDSEAVHADWWLRVYLEVSRKFRRGFD